MLYFNHKAAVFLYRIILKYRIFCFSRVWLLLKDVTTSLENVTTLGIEDRETLKALILNVRRYEFLT